MLNSYKHEIITSFKYFLGKTFGEILLDKLYFVS
jgi:hypothetical protein